MRPCSEIASIFIQYYTDLTDAKVMAEGHPLSNEKLKTNYSNKNEDSSLIASGIKCDTNLESLLSWTPPDSFSQNFSYEICGRTSCGCPVATIRTGSWECRKVGTKEERETLSKYIDLFYARLDEKMKKNSKKVRNKAVNQFIVVIDFRDFSVKQMLSFNGIGTLRQWASGYETKYTGSIKYCYIVNASSVFRALSKILKPLFSSNTLGCMEVYGTDQNEWKTVLLSKISEDHLPFSLGGSLVPTGTQVVDYKKLIYTRSYAALSEGIRHLKEDDDDG